MDWSSLLGQIWALVPNWASMSAQAKVSSIVLIVIALWKSSALQPYWAKLGQAANLVPPVLGLIPAVMLIHPFSWAAISAGLMGGVLAMPAHQLLDGIKVLPGIGPSYVAFINWVEGLLGSPAPEPPAPVVPVMQLFRKKK